jgi:hypothetical protein
VVASHSFVAIGIAEVLGDHRAHFRVRYVDDRALSGVHQVDAVGVVGLRGAHAADDGQPVGHLRQTRQVFAHLKAGHVTGDGSEWSVSRASRFHVEGVDLNGAAVHP